MSAVGPVIETDADLAPAPDDVDGRCIATLRMLSVDMV
jgi:hypothetical protein